MSEAPTRKTRCGRCHRARLVYKVDGLLGWVELCHACREELHIAALSAARDDVVRAATVIAPDIAREHDDGDGYRTVSLDSAEAAAFCAAVSAYEKLAGGA